MLMNNISTSIKAAKLRHSFSCSCKPIARSYCATSELSMYSRLQLSIPLLLFFLVSVALAVPARIPRTGEGIQMSDVDAGPLDVCEEATLSFCENIHHPVPASVAKIANILEKQIEHTYQDLLDNPVLNEACAEAVQQIRCTQSFPECSSESGTVKLSTIDDCVAQITENCGTLAPFLLDDGICSLGNGEFSLAECKSVSSYNYEFQHCPVDGSVEVTDWMFELMKHADSRLAYQFNQTHSLGDPQFQDCRENYARFSCQMQGQCQPGGQRAEIVNDYQLCDNVANCYRANLAERIRRSFVCELWPSPFSTITETTSTPQTSSSAVTSNTVFTAEPTWPTPSGTNGMSPVVGGTSKENSLSLGVIVLIAFTVALQCFYR